MSNQHLLEEERTARGRAEPRYRRTNPFGVNEDRDIELFASAKYGASAGSFGATPMS